jgi:tetratricopeptide (TPR) repeat protein
MHHIMTDIKQIANDIYSKEKTKSHQDLVDNFEKYENTIDAVDYNLTADTYDIYAQLIADYGIALTEIHSYKKATPYIDKALDLFRNNKKYTADTLHNVKFYETLLFNRGLCYYYLNKYELARPDFDLLVKLYPDNSIYPKWTTAIKNKNLSRLKNIMWYLVAGALLIESFLDKNTTIKDLMLGLGLLCLLVAIVSETLIYYRKKKYDA